MQTTFLGVVGGRGASEIAGKPTRPKPAALLRPIACVCEEREGAVSDEWLDTILDSSAETGQRLHRVLRVLNGYADSGVRGQPHGVESVRIRRRPQNWRDPDSQPRCCADPVSWRATRRRGRIPNGRDRARPSKCSGYSKLSARAMALRIALDLFTLSSNS